MVTRNDPHRPGAIIPSDYEYVLWYALSGGEWLPSSININCEMPTLAGVSGKHNPAGGCCIIALRASGVKFADHGGTGGCTVCGTGYTYGEIWKHRPTSEYIHIGHICAEKYGLLVDRSAIELERERRSKAKASYLLAEQNRARKVAFLARFPGLEEALKAEHSIIRDIAAKMNRYELSEKQVALVFKLADEVKNPAPPEKHVSAPEGRVTVRGKIVSVKSVEGPYGTSIKMVVKVETPEGSWLVWTTAPSAILGTEIKGHEVEFTATLTRGRDEFFAFGKRPTKARLL